MRGIFYYPLDIDVNCGTRISILAYAKLLTENDVTLDICFYKPAGKVTTFDRFEMQYFDRVYTTSKLPVPDMYLIEKEHTDLLHGTGITVPLDHLISAAAIITAGQYDFVGVHYTACHTLADLLPPELPKILFTHDLDAIVQMQKGNILSRKSTFSIHDEIARMNKFDLVTAIGPEDLELLQENEISTPVIEASSCPIIEAKITIRESMKNLLFMGSNVPFKQLSLEWFSEYCWPHLLELGFSGTLHIIGGISEFAKSLPALKHTQCEIHGYVPSISSYMLNTDLLISPYYYGGGIKTNILEAVGMGIPVITTHYGLTNTRFKPDIDILVGNNGQEFAEKIIAASPRERRQQLSESALNVINIYHSQNALVPLFESITKLVATKKAELKQDRTDQRDLILQELEARIPHIIREMKEQGINNIGVYGAGGHTDRLLKVWHNLNGPEISSIFVTGSPKSDMFGGYSILSIDELEQTNIEAMLLSSKLYEYDLALNTHNLAKELPIFPIWNPAMKIEEIAQMDLKTPVNISVQSEIPR